MKSNDYDGVKAEKASAIRRYNLLRTFSILFRFFDLCLSLALLSWIFARLPSALAISGDYFRLLFSFTSTPLFAFVLLNAIIASLLVKRPRGGVKVSCDDTEIELYGDLISNSGGDRDRDLIGYSVSENCESLYQDKEIVSEVSAAAYRVAEIIHSDLESDSDLDLDYPKVYRRSQSEKLMKQENCSEKKQPSSKLRRYETAKYYYQKAAGFSLENSKESLYYEEDSSGDVFQRKIEAFIAKELQFRREEFLAGRSSAPYHLTPISKNK